MMTALTYAANFFYLVWLILGPAGVLAALYYGVTELQRRGYSTTYATAIVRAVGAGFDRCKEAGVDPLSPTGRAMVLAAGVSYLKDNVATAAKKLGINTDDEHLAKVAAQYGVVQAEAVTAAQALEAGPLGSMFKMATTTALRITAGEAEQLREMVRNMPSSWPLTPGNVDLSNPNGLAGDPRPSSGLVGS